MGGTSEEGITRGARDADSQAAQQHKQASSISTPLFSNAGQSAGRGGRPARGSQRARRIVPTARSRSSTSRLLVWLQAATRPPRASQARPSGGSSVSPATAVAGRLRGELPPAAAALP